MASVVSASSLAAREAMIDSQLKPCGVISPRISAAFYAIEREAYVAPDRASLAYVDAPQPLGGGRELLSPLSLGRLLQQAAATEDDKVLIVGTATGYSAALLSELAGHVVALESDAGLAEKARANLQANTNVRVIEGPLEAGAPDFAPFDLILIDGAVEVLPTELIAQLAEGGRLLTILVGSDGVTRAASGVKQAGNLILEPFADVPGSLLRPFAKAPAFRF